MPGEEICQPYESVSHPGCEQHASQELADMYVFLFF